MKAEFISENKNDLPELYVIAEDDMEWNALCLYIKLMKDGRRGLSVALGGETEQTRSVCDQESDEGANAK